MDVIANIINRTCTCLEGICNDIECVLDSGCCHTHKKIHGVDSSGDLKDIELNEKNNSNDLKK